MKLQDLKCEFCDGQGEREINVEGADVPSPCSFCNETGIDQHQLKQLIKTDQAIKTELLELMIKAGRRVMHDFEHAVNEIPKNNPFREDFLESVRGWHTVFYPDRGPKNYRSELHHTIIRLENTMAVMRDKMKAAGLDITLF
jgi:hypothetical protein